MSDPNLTGDTPDLEALFDSIVQSQQEVAPAPEAAPATQAPAAHHHHAEDLSEPARSMFSQIGQLTRKLHDTLRELGLDKSLEKAASQIPDARDRLSYVANMTEQAAERTLNALDAARPLQEGLASESRALARDWDKLMANQLSVAEFKALAEKTRAHLAATPSVVDDVNGHLLEIMMAQDFQDLTGQVIKKILTMTKDMEGQLLDFLVEHSGGALTVKHEDGLLAGPVVSAEGRNDIVTDQQQVDDLLESLGF
ncbi:protein phosphatase CheZ [Chitinibacteraceae bacterium HSL-7]